MHVSAGVSEDATLEASLEVERDMAGENNNRLTCMSSCICGSKKVKSTCVYHISNNYNLSVTKVHCTLKFSDFRKREFSYTLI